MTVKVSSVDDYIDLFDNKTALYLELIREIIKEEAPHAAESLTYGMPAYKTYRKPLVYFGGYSNHIGFYPMPSGIEAFGDSLKGFKLGKGSIQFPLSEDLPVALITEIVRYRVKENESKYAKKK